MPETSPTTGLRDRLIEVLNTTLTTPDGGIETADTEWDRHDRHRFYRNCAACRGDVPAMVDAVMADVMPLLADAEAELERLRARADRTHTRHARHHHALATALGVSPGTDWAGLIAAARQLRQRAEKAEAERDQMKLEYDDMAAKWAIMAERTLIASTLVAEDMPADVEAELAPVRLDVLRKVLAGQAGRDDLVAGLLPKLAEAERQYAERVEAELERLRAELAAERARTAEAALDTPESPQDGHQ